MQDKIKKREEDVIKKLVEEIQADFRERRAERKPFEAQWQLNNNFVMGNQYCSIVAGHEVEDYSKQYFWQEREVFNHIAPLIEARLSKLARIKPSLTVMPASAEESDMKVAKLSRDIINATGERINIYGKILDATKWSEICGTSFYKVIWNAGAGKSIATDEAKMPIHEGDVEIAVIPPYEIFPESSCSGSIEECSSIIHAKAYNIQAIKNIWGVDIEGSPIDVFALDKVQVLGGLGYRASASGVVNSVKNNHAIVLEKYESPSVKYPNGRLIIVCEDKLLYMGELPYINATEHKRGYPFIRQVSIGQAGCFWGSSVIERTIPVQRAYNAVKNRKHEFLNRLSMGVLMVEDGSVDIENLEEEGLSPGKVLVYRQGSTPPSIMSDKSMPVDFSAEEERLIDEFTEISGVSYYTRNTNSMFSGNISGVTLQLLLEQDDARLNATVDSIKDAIKDIAKQILRLYKQYANTPRLLRLNNDRGEVEVFYWNRSDINSEDVMIDNSSVEYQTLAQRQNRILELLNAGLLKDDEGKMSASMRAKALEILGLGVWENGVDLSSLHARRAEKENLQFLTNPRAVEISEIDDHHVHIEKHIAFSLSREFEDKLIKVPNLKDKLIAHINLHKEYLKG